MRNAIVLPTRAWHASHSNSLCVIPISHCAHSLAHGRTNEEGPCGCNSIGYFLINVLSIENKNILLFMAQELQVLPFFVFIMRSFVDGPSAQFDLDWSSNQIYLLITFVTPSDHFLFERRLLLVVSS